jgi:hypothetical protein
MKRLTLTAFASALVVAIAPASALASHHHKRHHHKRVHHARVVHKRFGDVTTPTSPSTPSSDAVGTVDSFTGGVLTIKLNDGSTVSGKVTPDTEIECEAAENEAAMHADGDGGGGGGDNSGGDDNGRGDDNGNGDDEQGQSCSTTDLSSGMSVSGAELRITSAGAVWEKVRLIP